MEKTYERRRKEERKVDHNEDKEDCVLLDLDNFMTLDAVGSVDGEFLCYSLTHLRIFNVTWKFSWKSCH